MSAQDDAIANLQGDDGAISATANQVVVGASGGTPAGLDVAASRFVARLASGDLKACTVAEIKTLLAYALADMITPAVSVVSKHAVTVANCANTTTETTVFSYNIPANTLVDGGAISCFMLAQWKQNSGGAVNLTQRIKVGGSTVLTPISAASIANSASVGLNDRGLRLFRFGSDLYLTVTGQSAGSASSLISLSTISDSFSATSGVVVAGLDFTQDIAVEVTMQWASANALTFFNILGGHVLRV